MILWTFQPYSVYKQIVQAGEYICNPDKSPMLEMDNDNHFRDAYEWMGNQMKEKIGSKPANVIFPVWAWYRWGYKHQPPRFDAEAKNAITVCLKLKISDSEVLLSDFDMWHMVLGKSYIGDAKSQKEFDREYVWFDNLPKDKANKIMRQSWQKIFNITPRYGKWDMNGGYVQGCFWKSKKEYICKVWRIEKDRKSYRLDLMTPGQLSKLKNI